MRLDVSLDPFQYLEGRADHIQGLLSEGSFASLPGKWKVRGRSVANTIELQRELRVVTFDLEPLDGVARRVAGGPLVEGRRR